MFSVRVALYQIIDIIGQTSTQRSPDFFKSKHRSIVHKEIVFPGERVTIRLRDLPSNISCTYMCKNTCTFCHSCNIS